MQKSLYFLSIFFLGMSLYIQLKDSFFDNNYALSYEYVNVKDIAEGSYLKQDGKSTNFSLSLLSYLGYANKSVVVEDKKVWKAEEFIKTNYSKKEKNPEEPIVYWHLPIEMGTITQRPSYYHPAFDMISPRGTNEVIFPIANGIISSIYTDSAGALVVTVLHNIEGVSYTSLYAHLSRYADNIYVGKSVTINDALGFMGTTGKSTGVHLHISVVDCSLNDPNDINCYNLGRFHSYLRTRTSQGHQGLASYINVPFSWNSRNVS